MSEKPRNDRNSSDSEQGISRITVCGFKSIAIERSVEIRSLTILAGANSSGKSSIIQPLLLMKQTLQSNYEPAGAFLLDGPNVSFTSADELLSRLPPAPPADRLEVGIEGLGIDSDWSIIEKFLRNAEEDFDIEEMICIVGKGAPIGLRTDMEEDKILSVYRGSSGVFSHLSDRPVEAEVLQRRCFLEPVIRFVDRNDTIQTATPLEAMPADILGEGLRRIIHVPGLRGNPKRSYPRTRVGNDFPGTFEHYVASVINHWTAHSDRRLRDLRRHLQVLELTREVEAREINATQVELRVGRLRGSVRGEASDMVNVADAGFGVSQVLPVLVALLAAKPGQLVYLEQPELHLHPRAQVALAEILAEAAKRGVRVVAETHSALLLLAIQTLVAEESISPDEVALHWFTRRDDGVTEVTSRDLDEAGAFGDWPEDFGMVTQAAQSRFLDAVAACRWGK
ncbi:MAG: DUF3696 domain-containing protein [bacterium]